MFLVSGLFCLELALLAFLGLHGDDEVDELNRHVTRGNRAHVIKTLFGTGLLGQKTATGKAAK